MAGEPGRSAEETYRNYAGELTRFATVLAGPADAPDVVSGAVLRCLASGRWLSVEDPRAYLYRSVLNETRQQHRSTSRRERRELAVADRGEPTDAPEVRPEVLAAVAALSVRQRAVVMLTYWEDLAPSAVVSDHAESRSAITGIRVG